MIGVLLLSTTFLLMILLAVLILAWNMKKMAKEMEEINKQRFEKLEDRITETHNLITGKVTEIVNRLKDVI